MLQMAALPHLARLAEAREEEATRVLVVGQEAPAAIERLPRGRSAWRPERGREIGPRGACGIRTRMPPCTAVLEAR